MADTEPTHYVTHATDGRDAFMRISPSVLTNLDNTDNPKAQAGAQAHVAIGFRKASDARRGGAPGKFVDYPDLTLREIERVTEMEPVPMDNHGDPLDLDAE